MYHDELSLCGTAFGYSYVFLHSGASKISSRCYGEGKLSEESPPVRSVSVVQCSVSIVFF